MSNIAAVFALDEIRPRRRLSRSFSCPLSARCRRLTLCAHSATNKSGAASGPAFRRCRTDTAASVRWQEAHDVVKSRVHTASSRCSSTLPCQPRSSEPLPRCAAASVSEVFAAVLCPAFSGTHGTGYNAWALPIFRGLGAPHMTRSSRKVPVCTPAKGCRRKLEGSGVGNVVMWAQ